ncbi:hypothetical protein C5E02_07160 [Rathayibacter rathayi]|uniref:Uncharacterized protein n=2 Tax=Rathayibacter rathayi TaxID=33887 RepID=A0ABD6WAA1_RATRA|nr:hypothetical protein [Rathayibacter rathayi]SOE02970.1 hypothetical protein SAMN06295924_1022 [Rathayibacter rathayi NCPPB 2980 = VKM Ac-1601]AZZ49041.1 hypothetical protein C1O28_07400 [Rathayibacter rathayi]PPF15174.1 hypothetical protein C5C04_04625 [Rathayibacter rathayi]PPF51139.1 hypothetical protein C5C08_03390 [Rathayibacter rathayi]PPF82855.1 hypothetical protein C5C14_02940 [Rathayibacter rathayi]
MKNHRKTSWVPWLIVMIVIPVQISALARGSDAENASSWIFVLGLDALMIVFVYGVVALRRQWDERRRP